MLIDSHTTHKPMLSDKRLKNSLMPGSIITDNSIADWRFQIAG